MIPIWTYHRLVKTTPNPRATKNSRGELVGLELLFFPLRSVLVALEEEPVVVEDMSTEGDGGGGGVDNVQ